MVDDGDIDMDRMIHLAYLELLDEPSVITEKVINGKVDINIRHIGENAWV